MFRHDLEHSGSTDPSDIIPQGNLKWSFPTGAAVHSSPAVANGTVYFGSQDHKIYALDAENGTKRWEFETGSWINSSPAVANGVVYCGSNDGNLYALSSTGLYGSTDHSHFTLITPAPSPTPFGPIEVPGGFNVEGGASMDLFAGHLWCGSSSDGHLYRIE